MRRKIVLTLLVIVCFLLQTTLFRALEFANIAPNLMVVVVSSFGFMRGKKEGMWLGFFSGLLIDIFFGKYLGIYALIFMYIGYINGLFQKRFFPDDIKLPMFMIGASDLLYNLLVFFLMFMLRGKFNFWFYARTIILPELIYTMIVSIVLYFVFLKLNQWMERKEKRRAKKVDL